MPHNNPRNQLEELLRHIGLVAERHISVTDEQVSEQGFVSTVTARLPSGTAHSAEGPPTHGKTPSQLAACQRLLDSLKQTHPHLFQSWEALRVEAQAGDALIKMAVYLDPGLSSAHEASLLLQQFEANTSLARIFDRWRAAGDPDLVDWGEHLSPPRKGTLVEALIWRRFGEPLRDSALQPSLSALMELLSSDT